MMAEKAILCAQQTTRNGLIITTTSNGQKKKMKNLPVYKTVLAPNAPWPTPQEIQPKTKQVGLKKVKIACENDSLDYFLQTHEELNQYKITAGNRIRDKLSGRFKSN